MAQRTNERVDGLLNMTATKQVMDMLSLLVMSAGGTGFISEIGLAVAMLPASTATLAAKVSRVLTTMITPHDNNKKQNRNKTTKHKIRTTKNKTT